MIKIPPSRENLKNKIYELYVKIIPDGAFDIIKQLSLKYQFSSTDGQTFRERVRHEIQNIVFEKTGTNSLLSSDWWYELDMCIRFIRDWFGIIELGLSENAIWKIVAEERLKAYQDFKINEKVAKLYQKGIPNGLLYIIEQLQKKYQFSNTDEQSFRERVRYELQDAVLELTRNHFAAPEMFQLRLGNCLETICVWLEIMELGISEDVTREIAEEERYKVLNNLNKRIITLLGLEIPKGREDLIERIVKLYQKGRPSIEVLYILEQVQRRNQFSNTDEQTFKERFKNEIQDAVLELKIYHIISSNKFWQELDKCIEFIRDWLDILELGLSEEIKSKITLEESRIIVNGLLAEVRDKTNYEVVRNLEIFRTGTNKMIFNKYVYTRL